MLGADCTYLVERIGGTQRCLTLCTFAIHFLHALFCVVNYCYWVHDQVNLIGRALADAYLAFTVISCICYLFVASVFYMWAWRYPEPEESAKRRRIYGMAVNLLFCDIPIFVVEVKIVWLVHFANVVQGLSFCLTCISTTYSALRVWTFFLVVAVKERPGAAAAHHGVAYAAFPLPYPPGVTGPTHAITAPWHEVDSTSSTSASRPPRRSDDLVDVNHGVEVARTPWPCRDGLIFDRDDREEVYSVASNTSSGASRAKGEGGGVSRHLPIIV